MPVVIGTDQINSFARRTQPEPANLAEDVSRRRQAVVEHRRLNDRQELALQRSVIPLSSLPQALRDPVGGIFLMERLTGMVLNRLQSGCCLSRVLLCGCSFAANPRVAPFECCQS
jgi:hypothetical protein